MILDKLAASTKDRVEAVKKEIPIEKVIEIAENVKIQPFLFEKALKQEGLSFICEVKKASPSKGIIATDFPYLEIAKEYENIGANCISVLTEPEYFKGNDTYLSDIAKNVSIPVIRKDFTIDEYQIYEAKALGASAVLLIVSLLPLDILKKYIRLCDYLGLSALVEAHDENEVNIALEAGARMIGINNRNLKDFTVDVGNCIRLRQDIPSDRIVIAESGIKGCEDIRRIKDANIDGVLIGETLMRSENRKKTLHEMKVC